MQGSWQSAIVFTLGFLEIVYNRYLPVNNGTINKCQKQVFSKLTSKHLAGVQLFGERKVDYNLNNYLSRPMNTRCYPIQNHHSKKH